MKLARTECRGLFSIMPTPFTNGDELDTKGVASLVDFYRTSGARGVVVGARGGEGALLSATERETLLETTVAHGSAGLVVVAAILEPDALQAREQAARAASLGADAVMVPMPTDQETTAVLDHFAGIARAADRPIFLLDQPLESEEHDALITAVCASVDAVYAVVAAEEQSAPRIVTLRRALQSKIALFGRAHGGPEELESGAAGFVSGFTFPRLLVDICDAVQAAKPDRAARAFEAALPCLVREHRAPAKIAFRKEILRQRGLLGCAAVRHPTPPGGPAMDERVSQTLDRMANRIAPIEAGPPLSALVVEDMPTSAMLLSQILGRAGMEVDVARNGHQALEILRHRPVDVVITDLLMPHMSGMELISRLYQQVNRPAIVVITSVDDDAQRHDALVAGADDYLCKPYDPREVVERLRAAVRHHRAAPELARA